MVEEKKFLLDENTGEVIDIKQEDFEFVQKDKKIHDVKFKSKATTFFKDSLKRFAKSRSATIGASIVGALILLSIIVPFCTPDVGAFNVNRNEVGGDTAEKKIPPKLFPTGTGFWDGTQNKKEVIYNIKEERPKGYRAGTFSNLKTYPKQINSANVLGSGGQVGISALDFSFQPTFTSPLIDFDIKNIDYSLTVSTLEEAIQGKTKTAYKVSLKDEAGKEYLLADYTDSLTQEINISAKAKELNVPLTEEGKVKASVSFEVKNTESELGSIIFDDVTITSNSKNEEEVKKLNSISFKEGNELLLRPVGSEFAWSSNGSKTAYKVDYTYCDFTYDPYEDVYGNKEFEVSSTAMIGYQAKGEIKILLSDGHTKATNDKAELKLRFPITQAENGLFVEVIEQIGDAEYNASRNRYENYSLKCILRGYRYYGYDSKPIFIFGTNDDRRDYFKLIFTSMRFSFILAISVSLVNILIGLIWGSISGYFGGWTDLIMERLVEIIGSIPATVVITLCIMYGNQFGWGKASDVIALMLALFLTGWMGVAGRTRTQFYRFKGREYVLASRTLGAKDSRLIFRHILPNSMGTIITSSILMIPNVIYTEASIAYLGLGLSGQNMFGVILSEANSYYRGESTFLLIIPTVLMALLLVSFNLFGNGLRDAFNPQLKGSE